MIRPAKITELSLRDYLFILKKRRVVIIFVAFIVISFAAFFTFIMKPDPIYEATSQVKIEKVTDFTGLFVEALIYSPADIFETQTIVVKSADVLEHVAKELNLIPANISSEEIIKEKKYSAILQRLRNSIDAKREGYTNIINIKATSPAAEDAKRLSNLVAEKYKEVSTISRNKRVFEAKKFIEKQLQIIEASLNEKEERLKSFREQYSVINLSNEETNLLRRFADIEVELSNNLEKLQETEYTIEQAKKGEALPDKTGGRIFVEEGPGILLSHKAKYADLMIKRQELLIYYRPEHPLIKDTDERIKIVKNELLKELDTRKYSFENKIWLISEEFSSLKNRISRLPKKALDLARMEREVKMNEDLYSALKSKHQEVQIKEAEKIEEVSIVEYASTPPLPINAPDYSQRILIGALFGALLGLLSAIVAESLDTSIASTDEIERILEVPVLGVIPHIDEKTVMEKFKKLGIKYDRENINLYRRLFCHFAPDAFESEAYRALRTNLLALPDARVILVTSPSTTEGKTMTITNLAIVLGQIGKRVLIVDADLRASTIHNIFGIKREPGLSDIILGNRSIKDAIRSIVDLMVGGINIEDIIRSPGLDNIYILPSGTRVSAPSEVLGSPSVKEIINKAKEQFDIILLDTPPLLPIADAPILSENVDGVLLVYQAGRIPSMTLRRAKSNLDNVNAKIFGVLINNLKKKLSPDYYKETYAYYKKGYPPK